MDLKLPVAVAAPGAPADSGKAAKAAEHDHSAHQH
jgi:hypothetical protein